MSTFKKEYTTLADAINTYAIVTPATKIEDKQPKGCGKETLRLYQDGRDHGDRVAKPDQMINTFEWK